MIDRMSTVASSPVIAIVAAGATLANPGALIPIALKDISETDPSTGRYIAEWVGFAVVSLLPLSVALIMLCWPPSPRCGCSTEPASCSRRTRARSRP